MEKMTEVSGMGTVRGLGLYDGGKADQPYTWEGKRWDETGGLKKAVGFLFCLVAKNAVPFFQSNLLAMDSDGKILSDFE